MKRVLNLLWALWALNTALVALGLYALHSPPSQNVRLTSREYGLILYGDNLFGIRSLRTFRDWDELAAYLKDKDWALPTLSYAEKSGTSDIALESTEPNIRTTHYKLTWFREGTPQVLFAPDEASARIFAHYLRYDRLAPANLGYSLSLD